VNNLPGEVQSGNIQLHCDCYGVVTAGLISDDYQLTQVPPSSGWQPGHHASLKFLIGQLDKSEYGSVFPWAILFRGLRLGLFDYSRHGEFTNV